METFKVVEFLNNSTITTQFFVSLFFNFNLILLLCKLFIESSSIKITSETTEGTKQKIQSTEVHSQMDSSADEKPRFVKPLRGLNIEREFLHIISFMLPILKFYIHYLPKLFTNTSRQNVH